MNILELRNFFIGCSIINYTILILWFLFFRFARPQLQFLIEKAMNIKTDSFEIFHLFGISLYKMIIITFFVVPAVVLSFI